MIQISLINILKCANIKSVVFNSNIHFLQNIVSKKMLTICYKYHLSRSNGINLEKIESKYELGCYNEYPAKQNLMELKIPKPNHHAFFECT